MARGFNKRQAYRIRYNILQGIKRTLESFGLSSTYKRGVLNVDVSGLRIRVARFSTDTLSASNGEQCIFATATLQFYDYTWKTYERPSWFGSNSACAALEYLRELAETEHNKELDALGGL